MAFSDGLCFRLSTFDYRGVELWDERLLKQFNQTKETYLNLDEHALLYGFRRRAGRPAPGKSLGGWYGDDVFNAFGQYLSGLSKMYAASGDARLREKAARLIEGWVETIEPDGYCFYSDKAPKATHYFIDKMVGGLCDAFRYGNIEGALIPLGRVADWAAWNLDRSNPYAKNAMHSPTEWYTLSENLFRAYEITGDDRYRALAQAFFYDEYYELLLTGELDRLMRAGEDSSTRRYHAFSHVNCLGGAAMAYKLTGDAKYLDVLTGAYRMLKDTQLYATGGYGPVETFMQPGQRGECLRSEKHHFETPCGSWAAFKFVKYLTEFTGEARYGDWAEQLLYNGIGAALPIKANGEVMYFSGYSLQGAQKMTMNPWSCCTGTYPQAVADYCDLIYCHGDDGGIYISQYLSSRLTWQRGEKRCALTQETSFPEEDSTKISLSLPEPSCFPLGLRLPGWLLGQPEVLVNGRAVQGITRDGWLVLDRLWLDGDSIQVRFPLRAVLCPVEDGVPFPAAYAYGPVVLVTRQKTDALRTPPAELIRVESLRDGLLFEGPEGAQWVPFYSVPEGETYYMFLEGDHGRVPAEDISFEPRDCWQREDWGWLSCGYRARLRIRFRGTGVRLVGKQLENGGWANVSIDGERVASVSQYGPFFGIPWMWEKTGLPDGTHELLVELDNERTPPGNGLMAARGCAICLSHVSALPSRHHV